MRIKIRLFLIVLLFGFFINSLFAQKTYLNINFGYNTGLSSQNLPYFNFQNLIVESDLVTVEQENVSFGKGFVAGGDVGYMFNERIGVEFGVYSLFSDKRRVTHTTYNYTEERTLSAKMIRIEPSIIIAYGREKISPYIKFGLAIGSGTILFEEDFEDNIGQTSNEKHKYSSGIALGLSSGLGVVLTLNDRLALFSEVKTVAMSYAPKKGEWIEFTRNGIDHLEGLGVNDREIEFVNKYDNSIPSSEAEPRKELKQYFPFGSFGLNIGLRVTI